MPIIWIENVGKGGLSYDVEKHDLPPEVWSDVLNMDFLDGYAQKSGGFTNHAVTPTVDPFVLQPWNEASEFRYLYASRSKIHFTNLQAITDITRTSGGDYTGKIWPQWTGGTLHGVPILNHDNATDFPQRWNGSTNKMQDLDNWPAGTYCQFIRPFQNFLVAGGITSGGLLNPYIIRWSHPADPGTVPSTWDITDATKLAGEQTIAQTGGRLVDCLPLGGTNILYKQDSIWAMKPIQGVRVFGFSELTNTIGALGIGCIQELNRNHFIVGTDDIVMFNGIRPQSLITKRLRTWFFNNLSPTDYDKTIVTKDLPNRRMIISFVSAGSVGGYFDKALIWNWEDNTWTIKDLPQLTFLTNGQVNTGVVTYDNVGTTYDTENRTYDQLSRSPAGNALIACKVDTARNILLVDDVFTSQGVKYTSRLQKVALAIVGTGRDGQPKVDTNSIKLCRGVYPKITANPGTIIQIRVGGQEFPEGAITWEPTYPFDPSVDTFVPTLTSARFLAVEFFETEDKPWKLTGYGLDLDVTSEQ